MCSTCGCGKPDEEVKMTMVGEKGHHHSHANHDHVHDHDHSHDHQHSHSSREIELEQDILQKNNLLAERNRGYLQAKNAYAINLVSSPGSGKTTLLEATIKRMKEKSSIYVIEGDQQTTNDADRIAATGVKALQINTGKGCHLDAHMILHAIQKMEIKENALLLIENVGNLVCPSMFDLGENERVVIMSVTEGEDKPIKYPDMFLSSNVCIFNKVDLLPYLDFDMEKARVYAKKVNPKLQFFELSATKGDGMEAWLNWLLEKTGKTAPAM
jgi:hydrogenase nickel incorporation protein HypB